MKNKRLIEYDELKGVVIAQSQIGKKLPKIKKSKNDQDSYLESFF